jgi:hypothetical protein
MLRLRAAASLCFVVFIALVLIGTCPGEVQAYIDPGTTGMLSQVLYVLFYGALGVFFYFLRYIKEYLTSTKQFFKRLFGWGV